MGVLQEVGACLGDEAIGRSRESGRTLALIGIFSHKDHNRPYSHSQYLNSFATHGKVIIEMSQAIF